MRVWITADGERLARLSTACREAGFTVQGTAANRVPHIEERAARLVLDLRWRLFPSPRAVEAWRTTGLGFARSTHVGACCPATAELLAAAGARVSVVSPLPLGRPFALAVLRHAAGPERNEAVGVLLGQRQAVPLVATLVAAGRRTRCATVTSRWRTDWPDLPDADVLVLTSTASAADLPATLGAVLPIVALGPATVAMLARRGWPAVQAATPTPRALVGALERLRAVGARPTTTT